MKPFNIYGQPVKIENGAAVTVELPVFVAVPAERLDQALKTCAGTVVDLSRLQAKTDEKQYAVALMAWDTADFATARTLALWCMWNSEATVKLPLSDKAEVYAVNWLCKRIYKVKPISQSAEAITFATARDDDVFCYEIVR